MADEIHKKGTDRDKLILELHTEIILEPGEMPVVVYPRDMSLQEFQHFRSKVEPMSEKEIREEIRKVPGRAGHIQVLGERLRVIPPSSIASTRCLSMSTLSTHSRQIMVFGLEGQKALHSLRVGLVGCGGIGSIMAEGLMRLGIMRLLLVDGDNLDRSNLNRWQGGRLKDVGKNKAHVLARRLRTMNPNIKVSSIALPLTHPKSLAAIKGADVLIGAVDNHQARFLMNRISAQYLI
ncbi:MAG: ThiF family adenylyltransferase, partial [Nitrososphaera sp.]